MRTEFVTTVNDTEVYRGDDLEKAIRAWDGATFNADALPIGGITVQQWDGDLMVRDGNILHVVDEGNGSPVHFAPRIYLNPGLALA